MPGLSPEQIMLTMMLGASSAFATPIGYQTNLMVLGRGGCACAWTYACVWHMHVHDQSDGPWLGWMCAGCSRGAHLWRLALPCIPCNLLTQRSWGVETCHCRRLCGLRRTWRRPHSSRWLLRLRPELGRHLKARRRPFVLQRVPCYALSRMTHIGALPCACRMRF